MIDRRSPRRAAADREWDHFVTANRSLIASSGIPSAVVTSVAAFDAFLRYGHAEHLGGADTFRVSDLSDSEYAALLLLVEAYFVTGYEWFTPAVLLSIDQQRLRSRFAAGSPD